MEYVTIISQEAITRALLWPVIVVASIGGCFSLAACIVAIIGDIKGHYVYEHCVKLILHAVYTVLVMFITMGICAIFFPVETGRYKYEGTLDPDMTIVEFEKFQQQYDNVRFEDGVWKWEDKQ